MITSLRQRLITNASRHGSKTGKIARALGLASSLDPVRKHTPDREHPIRASSSLSHLEASSETLSSRQDRGTQTTITFDSADVVSIHDVDAEDTLTGEEPK